MHAAHHLAQRYDDRDRSALLMWHLSVEVDPRYSQSFIKIPESQVGFGSPSPETKFLSLCPSDLSG